MRTKGILHLLVLFIFMISITGVVSASEPYKIFRLKDGAVRQMSNSDLSGIKFIAGTKEVTAYFSLQQASGKGKKYLVLTDSKLRAQYSEGGIAAINKEIGAYQKKYKIEVFNYKGKNNKIVAQRSRLPVGPGRVIYEIV